jgi:peptidoglycan-associated lipoprotein
VAELIGRSGNVIVSIEGHTDSIGNPEYNKRLSERRAEAVKAHLVDAHAIAPERLIARGYGEARPAVPNTDPDGLDNVERRQRNRRVEIIIGPP